jgi:hypothetical protein
VAQPGRAQRSGRWGRWFKSSLPDQNEIKGLRNLSVTPFLWRFGNLLPGASSLFLSSNIDEHRLIADRWLAVEVCWYTLGATAHIYLRMHLKFGHWLKYSFCLLQSVYLAQFSAPAGT